MNFREWMEATVSSDGIGEAMRKSLEFGVEGEWRDVGTTREKTSPPSVKFFGNLFNEKGRFLVTAYARLGSRLGPSLFSYDSRKGSEDLGISASLIYFDGKGGYSKIGERSADYSGDSPSEAYGHHLKTPYDLATWVRSSVDKFGGFGGEGGDDHSDSPTPSDSNLVGV